MGEGVARFGNDDRPFISLQLAVADRRGDPSRTKQLLKRCNDYGDPRLVKDCKLAVRQEAREEKQKASMPNVAGVLGGLPWKP